MSDFIGITSGNDIWGGRIKRHLLMFDRIGINGLQFAIDGARKFALMEAEECPDIEALREQGFLFETEWNLQLLNELSARDESLFAIGVIMKLTYAAMELARSDMNVQSALFSKIFEQM